MQELIVAKILKPQGLKGELKCMVLTDVLAVFNGDISEFEIDGKTFKASSLSLRSGFLYAKFDGVNDRNAAEKLRDKNILLDKEIIESLSGDEILIDDLIGKVLYDEDGKMVGQIVDYEEYGASGIFSIEENGHIFSVPFLSAIFLQNGKDLTVKRKEYDLNKI